MYQHTSGRHWSDPDLAVKYRYTSELTESSINEKISEEKG